MGNPASKNTVIFHWTTIGFWRPALWMTNRWMGFLAHQWGVESNKTGNNSGFQRSHKTIGCSIIQTLQICVGLIVWTRGEVIIESHAPIILLLFAPEANRFDSSAKAITLNSCHVWALIIDPFWSEPCSVDSCCHCCWLFIWCYTAWYCRDLHSWLEFSSISRMGWHGDFRQGSMHNGTPGIKISSRSLTFLLPTGAAE